MTPPRYRAVALLWGGLATSAVGDQLYAVALAWIGVSVFGARAGYLSATLVIGSRETPTYPHRLVLAGKIVNGSGTGLLGLAGLLPSHLALPALAVSAAVAAIGGPMGDIPVAVLRQTSLPVSEIPAAMRAYTVASSGGSLAALLIAPTLIQHLGLFAVTIGCAALIMGSGLGGFLLLSLGNGVTSTE